MKYGLGILLMFLVFSCTKDNIPTFSDLNGKWVDINTKTDTLIFKMIGDSEMMFLERGKETRNGFLLPKYGSGHYDYKLLTSDNKISLRWGLSSNMSFNDYYFKQSGDKLIVEKFFDISEDGRKLTFKKIN